MARSEIGTVHYKEFAQEVRNRASQALDTAETYRSIGYSGSAAMAERQAIILNNTALKIERGRPVMDYETRKYQ